MRATLFISILPSSTSSELRQISTVHLGLVRDIDVHDALAVLPRVRKAHLQADLLVKRRGLALYALPQLEPELLPSIQTFLVVGDGLLDDRALVADDGPRLLGDGEVLARADRLDDLAFVVPVQCPSEGARDERREDAERPLGRDHRDYLWVRSWSASRDHVKV